MTAHLRELGFDVLPSSANFVFARHEKRQGRRTGARPARPRRAGAPFQRAAHRGLFAHHHRNGRADGQTHRGAAGYSGSEFLRRAAALHHPGVRPLMRPVGLLFPTCRKQRPMVSVSRAEKALGWTPVSSSIIV